MEASQPILPQICEHSAGAETQQRDGDCQEREVIKKHNRKQSRESEFEQQCGEATEGYACQQGALAAGFGRQGLAY